LCTEVKRRWNLRHQVNLQLLRRLDQIEGLSGFTGQPGFIGIRKGNVGTTPTLPCEESLRKGRVSDEDYDGAAEDEGFGDDVEKMMNFIESIVN
jgi:hypothetical protein